MRIGMMDATGGLVRIPKSKRLYPKILNYFLVLKDLRNFKDEDMISKRVLISELASSRHTVYAIATFLRFLKEAYERKFKSRLCFRIMVVDYSWATMHALLETLNLDTVETYSKRVFKIATASETDLDFDYRTWICSCSSHTMHRIARCLKTIIKDNYIKDICCYSFSLLMN